MSRKVIEVASKYTTSNGQTKWRNCIVGSAFPRDDGSWSLQIDPGVSIASLEGVRITLKEPFVRDQQRESTPAKPPAGIGSDDIPF
jgi:hypothetical protein